MFLEERVNQSRGKKMEIDFARRKNSVTQYQNTGEKDKRKKKKREKRSVVEESGDDDDDDDGK